MRVSVRFVDGEQLEGEAEHVSLDRGGFTLSGPGGNTRSVWVGSGAIKYIVMIAPGGRRSKRVKDPRDGMQLTKVVLHFLDGEILHSYQDEVFGEEPGGFVVRLWDRERHQLVKALVSGSSLKGVFFVDEWDSRTEDEKRSRTSPDEATSRWIDRVVAAAEAPAAAGAGTPEREVAAVAEPALQGPKLQGPMLQGPMLQGPMLVEEPELLEAAVLSGAPVLAEVQEPGVQEPVVQEPVGQEPVVQEPVVQEPAAQEPMMEEAVMEEPVGQAPVVALIVGDTEERRPSFRSALIPRRMVATAVPGPEELRYRLLRARISEVLGQAGPAEHDDDEDPDEAG